MKFLRKVAVFLLLSISVSACGAKDEPLPFTPEKLKELSKKLSTQSKAITHSGNKEKSKQDVLEMYKSIIESDLGYNFDKTLRKAFLFQGLSVSAANLMAPSYMLVAEDPKWTLDNGYISKRTFETQEVFAKTKGAMITNNGLKFVDYVIECQNKNNGICNSKLLIPIMVAHGGLSVEESQKHSILIDNIVIERYNIGQWLIHPNGTFFNPYSFSANTSDFVINKESVEASKKMTKIYEEEKKELGGYVPK